MYDILNQMEGFTPFSYEFAPECNPIAPNLATTPRTGSDFINHLKTKCYESLCIAIERVSVSRLPEERHLPRKKT